MPEQVILGTMILTVVSVWTYVAGSAAYYSGDMMIGFHPAVLAYPILIWSAIAALLLSLIIRKWWLVLFCVISVATSMIVDRYGRLLPEIAWERSIASHDTANAIALKSVEELREIPSDGLLDLWDDQKLAVIPAFEWYVRPHIAASDGKFRGFSLAGVKHVRIQKIRHGWRGLALVEAPFDLERLKSLKVLGYEQSKTPRWVIWTTETHQPD